MKDLNYYKNNCEEDYIKTPISVLRYITELEKEAITVTRCCESDSELSVCGCGKNKPVKREPAYLHCDWCGSITVETK